MKCDTYQTIRAIDNKILLEHENSGSDDQNKGVVTPCITAYRRLGHHILNFGVTSDKYRYTVLQFVTNWAARHARESPDSRSVAHTDKGPLKSFGKRIIFTLL